MMRVLILFVLGVGLFLAGRALVRALASDETKIRWLVEDMADGFDRTRMDPILDGLAPDFVDQTSGANRQEVREALAYLFFNAKDERTKGFPYRVDVEIAQTTLARSESGPPSAECRVNARFRDIRGGKETTAWEIAVTAHLERGDGGWRIRRSSYATKSGQMLR
jgi:hypothetical protein